MSKKGTLLSDAIAMFMPSIHKKSIGFGFWGNTAIIGGISLIGYGLCSKKKANKEKKSAQDAIVRRIQKDELVAYGFVAPRKEIDLPKLIPTEAFDSKSLDWKKASLIHDDINYMDITIIENHIPEITQEVKPQIEHKVDTETQKALKAPVQIEESKTPVKKRGRPSLKNDVLAVFQHLKVNGVINFQKASKKSIYTQVSFEVSRNNDSVVYDPHNHRFHGLGYDAINNMIGPIVDAEIEKHKNDSIKSD